MRTALFKDSSFKWLLSGAALSMLGDQFTLIAMPWLVLNALVCLFVARAMLKKEKATK